MLSLGFKMTLLNFLFGVLRGRKFEVYTRANSECDVFLNIFFFFNE